MQLDELASHIGISVDAVESIMHQRTLDDNGMSRLNAFVSAVESFFLPGMEPTMNDWYAIESLLMPVRADNKMLRNTRRLRGMTIPAACDASGMSVRSWRMCEEHGHRISDRNMDRISRALHIDRHALEAGMWVTRAKADCAEWIRQRRIEQGMSVETLAARMGKTKRTIERWESGIYRFPTAYIVRLARALDEPVSKARKICGC